QKKIVVVFGIFDGVHDGHRSLFCQAKEHGDELVVIVGRDSASLKWKGKKPKRSQQTRLSLVMKEEGVSDAVLGDEEQSSYKILKNLHPDVVCFGYDQNDLEQDLRTWLAQKGKDIPLIHLKPYQSDLYHNSFDP
ncbi:adenylyltransferase/cytidyltransferase family protein, partial [Patescibacteria group bacterium]|nr:adenylyltransferase/cytidyltransferase family protein [Patescibacteria group bacterium]